MAYIKFNSLHEDILDITDLSFYKGEEDNDNGKHYYTIVCTAKTSNGNNNSNLYYNSEAARNTDYERIQEYTRKNKIFIDFTKFSEDSIEFSEEAY